MSCPVGCTRVHELCSHACTRQQPHACIPPSGGGECPVTVSCDACGHHMPCCASCTRTCCCCCTFTCRTPVPHLGLQDEVKKAFAEGKAPGGSGKKAAPKKKEEGGEVGAGRVGGGGAAAPGGGACRPSVRRVVPGWHLPSWLVSCEPLRCHGRQGSSSVHVANGACCTAASQLLLALLLTLQSHWPTLMANSNLVTH